MSYIIVTINISEYIPTSFNFEGFKFIFNFGDVINFYSKNKIIKKIKLEKKDINFSIKVIKKDSLIGICDYTIPYESILVKEIPSYEKGCLINMTDSTKRILSINNFNLKIKIHCDIKYIDKDKEEKLSENQPKIFVNLKKNNNNSKINKNPIYKKINNNNKLIYNKPRNYAYKNKFKEKNNCNININEDNSFDIEEQLTKKHVIIDTEFSKYIPNLIKENPLDFLSKMEDINDMIIFTKDIIIKFLCYQKEYNNRLKNAFDIYDKYFKLKKIYSQKYANTIKVLKIMEKKTKINEIKKNLNKNILVSNLFRIVGIKNEEIDFFKYISDTDKNNLENNYDDDVYEDNLNINDINNNYDNMNDKNRKYNILYTLIKNCYINYGKNENIIKIIPNSILDKCQLEFNKYDKIEEDNNYLNISLADNDENISDENSSNNDDNEKENKTLYYVESKINDEIDYELDNYLKDFYNINKNIPIIKFKKIKDNNYKYGKTQIIIIEEGDKIKIKDDNGIFSLDNYLEINSKNDN